MQVVKVVQIEVSWWADRVIALQPVIYIPEEMIGERLISPNNLNPRACSRVQTLDLNKLDQAVPTMGVRGRGGC